jgi:hypothetical protein
MRRGISTHFHTSNNVISERLAIGERRQAEPDRNTASAEKAGPISCTRCREVSPPEFMRIGLKSDHLLRLKWVLVAKSGKMEIFIQPGRSCA